MRDTDGELLGTGQHRGSHFHSQAQAASCTACQAWVLCSTSALLGREIGLNGPLCSAYQELAGLSVGNCAQAQK